MSLTNRPVNQVGGNHAVHHGTLSVPISERAARLPLPSGGGRGEMPLPVMGVGRSWPRRLFWTFGDLLRWRQLD